MAKKTQPQKTEQPKTEPTQPEQDVQTTPEAPSQYPEPTPPTEPLIQEPRKINLIVLHCSDSDNPKHDNVKTIREWHTQRGFIGPDGVEGTEDDIGYHFVITKDGKVHEGRPVSAVGAHCKNHNAHSIGICLTGKTYGQFTKAQFKSLRGLLLNLFKHHQLDWKHVRLHNQLDSGKTCPNFKIADAVNG